MRTAVATAYELWERAAVSPDHHTTYRWMIWSVDAMDATWFSDESEARSAFAARFNDCPPRPATPRATPAGADSTPPQGG